jgi:hypothetical protein
MIGNVEDLSKIWATLDTCYERPRKYMAKAKKPIVEFRRYRIVDSGTIREFYSWLRPTIKSVRIVGLLKLLINDQMIPSIMGKIPHTDWKLWATSRLDWIHEDIEEAVKKFMEQK